MAAGGIAEIVVQKNLDHYNSAQPGNFTFYGFTSGSTKSSPLLALLPDTSAPSLSLYRVSLPVPSGTPAGDYVLQVRTLI